MIFQGFFFKVVLSCFFRILSVFPGLLWGLSRIFYLVFVIFLRFAYFFVCFLFVCFVLFVFLDCFLSSVYLGFVYYCRVFYGNP